MRNGSQQQWRRQGSRRGSVGIPQQMLGLLGQYLDMQHLVFVVLTCHHQQ